MRFVVGALVLGACGFHVSGSRPAADADPSADAAEDAAPDAAIDATVTPIDAPIDAAITIDALACGVLPGDSIDVSPMTGWEMSANGTTWTPVALPSTNWPCDNCTRFFRTTVCGQPESVTFRFASDNRARMRINGTIAYDQYWIAGYCTDQLCCSRCCDSTANCNANMSSERTLDAAGLSLFTTATTNTVTWEVSEEIGGSGFHNLMTIGY